MASRAISENEEIRVLLIGSPAAGKSATGNAIAGENVFKEYAVVDPNNRQTKTHPMDRFGYKIRIIDPPGFLFTEDPEKIDKADWEELRRNVDPGPHAIVLVISAANRFHRAEVKSLCRLRDAFSIDLDKFCVIVFTGTEMWEEQGCTVKTFFQTLPNEVQELLNPCIKSKRALAFQKCIEQDAKAKQLHDILKEIKIANKDHYIDAESLMQSLSVDRPPPVPHVGSTKRPHEEEAAQDESCIDPKRLGQSVDTPSDEHQDGNAKSPDHKNAAQASGINREDEPASLQEPTQKESVAKLQKKSSKANGCLLS